MDRVRGPTNHRLSNMLVCALSAPFLHLSTFLSTFLHLSLPLFLYISVSPPAQPRPPLQSSPPLRQEGRASGTPRRCTLVYPPAEAPPSPIYGTCEKVCMIKGEKKGEERRETFGNSTLQIRTRARTRTRTRTPVHINANNRQS